jgi:hypothetical protein
VPPSPINFEDLQRIQRKVEQETEDPNRYSRLLGERYIFDEALNAGELDLRLRQFFDDVEAPRYTIDQLRSEARPSNFDNIPFRGEEINPYDINFDLANIAAAQPENARAFLNRRIISPEVSQNFYEGFLRAPRSEINEIMNTLDRYSNNPFTNTYGEEAGPILDEINRVGRGQPEAPSIANLYQPVNERTRQIRQIFNDVDRPVQNYFLSRGSLISDLSEDQSLATRSRPRRRQLRLNLPGEDNPQIRLREQGNRMLLEGPPPSFDDLESYTNRLYQITRDLSRLRTIQPRVLRQQRIDQVLPSIRESRFGDEIVESISGRENRPLPTSEQYEPDDSARMRRSLEFNPAELRNSFGNLGELFRRTGQFVIPNLEKEVTKSLEEAAISGLKKTLKQYPEMIPLLSRAPKTKAPVGGKKEILEYADFIDTSQQVSDPKDRANIYNRLMTESGIPSSDLFEIESDYTSGNTERQQRAIERLSKLNPEAAKDLTKVSSQAASSVRPLIGGGKYLGRNDSTAIKLIENIDERARVFREVFKNLSPEARDRLFDKYSQEIDNPLELYVRYNPETDEVTPEKIPDNKFYDDKMYGLKIHKYSPLEPSVAGSSSLSYDNFSENALKFLAKNPILGTTTIGFQTFSPESPDFSYDAKDLPPAVSKAFTEFVSKNALAGLPPGTLVTNSPIAELDLEELAEGKGIESSTFRKQQEVIGTPANKRGIAYQRGGFGPVSADTGKQSAYINKEGKVIPLQLERAEKPIRGGLYFTGDRAEVYQSSLPSNKTYYSLDPVMGGVRGAFDMGRAIKKTPASLLPGVSDLIPSPEAIQTGYKRGPIEMGKQMGREFIESLPIGTALAAALSTPLLARAAPGVGLAFIGTAVAEAANEVVRQETGEGILPKLRQFLGTKKRSGIADRELPKPNQPLIPVIPEISAPSAQSKMEMIRRQNRNELQRRADLIKERFNPRKGEFGLSELLFGR